MAQHQAAISWVAPATGDAPLSYDVQRALVTAGVAGAFASIASVQAPTVTYLDTTVIGGDSYEFRVASVNAGGESAFVTSSVELIPLAAPAPPTGLTVVVS